MKRRLETIIFLTTLTLCPVSVNASFGFPANSNGINDWPISLELGESWQESDGTWHRGHMGIDLVEDEYENIYIASQGIIDKVNRWPKCNGYIEICNDTGCEIKKERSRGWGPTVVIKHEYEPTYTTDGTYLEATPAEDSPSVVYTQYGHLDSVEHLSEGQAVEKGEYLGKIGQICGWIPHLHFEIKDQEAIDYDRTYSSGAGFGYSGTDGHAPHRYIPQAFIEANKHLELPHEDHKEPTQSESQSQSHLQPKERTSVFSRIKNFFANIFSRNDNDEVEGEISNNEEQIQEPAIEIETAEPSETDLTPTYDAELLATAPITIAVSDREALVTIQARNTGNQDWQQSQVSLNVVGGRAANSEYRHSSWLTDLRPTRLDQSRVAPGDIGTFTTLIRVPEGSGDVTFRAQLVRQTGSQFVQLGSGFAAVDIQVKEFAEEPEVAGEQVADDGSDLPSGGITRQIRETINRVTRDVGETIGDAVDQLSETTKRIFFGGGGSSSASNNSNNTDDTEPTEVVYAPTISITSPTSSPYIIATSSIEITGAINDVVRSMSVSTTASGTLSFSTTSLTWQWIGNLESGTTTFGITAASSEQTTSTVLVVYYAPVYTLDAPVIFDPTTSSVWYSNTTSTLIRGTVDSRATQLMQASSSIPIVSSTWEYLVNTTEEGSYSYEFISSDEFGNMSTSTDFSLVYDITAPTVVTSSFALASTTVEYTLLATDTLSGIAEFDMQIRASSAGEIGVCMDSTSTLLLADVDSTSTCQWGIGTADEDNGIIDIPDVLQQRDLIIRWRAIDAAGNSADWESQEVPVAQAEVVTSGVIVFSQIAWMGTKASPNDEWFEIYNTTGAFINMYGWYITWGEYNTSSSKYDHRFDFLPEAPENIPEISESEVVIDSDLPPPVLYFVFERTDQSTISSPGISEVYTGDLRNTGELMQLWNADGELVDQVDMRAGWAAGDNDTKESMVRIDPSVSGSRADNWCSFLSCPAESLAGEMQYVDADGNPIIGSPRLIVLPDVGSPPTPEL